MQIHIIYLILQILPLWSQTIIVIIIIIIVLSEKVIILILILMQILSLSTLGTMPLQAVQTSRHLPIWSMAVQTISMVLLPKLLPLMLLILRLSVLRRIRLGEYLQNTMEIFNFQHLRLQQQRQDSTKVYSDTIVVQSKKLSLN